MAEITNSLQQVREGQAKTFVQTLETKSYQEYLATSIPDKAKRERFQTAIIASVQATPGLKDADPRTIITGAMRGEALGLSPAPELMDYSLVPRKIKEKRKDGSWEEKTVAVFQLGVNGVVQLAMRTGDYVDLGTIEIRRGEIKGRNPRTGKMEFSFINDDEEREKQPIVGFLAFFELKNGFYKNEYWSKEKCIQHANTYVPYFTKEEFERFEKANGQTDDWKQKAKWSQPWFAHFSEMAQGKVLKKLLKRAPRSIEMQKAESYEEEYPEMAKPTGQEIKEDFFKLGEGDQSEIQEIDDDGVIVEPEDNATEVPTQNDVENDEKTVRTRGKKAKNAQENFFNN